MRRASAFGVALVAVAAMAAPAAAGPLGYGLRFGANFSDLRGDFATLADPAMKVGTEGGLFVDYAVSPDLALQLDVDYVTKGATFKSEETDNTGNTIGTLNSKLQLRYVELPLMVRMTVRPWGAGAPAPYLIGGPTLSIKLDGTFEHDGVTGLADQDVSGDMNDFLWGVTGGLGMRFPTETLGLAVEARYRTDFGDLWDVDDNYQSINHGLSVTFLISR